MVTPLVNSPLGSVQFSEWVVSIRREEKANARRSRVGLFRYAVRRRRVTIGRLHVPLRLTPHAIGMILPSE